MIISWVSSLDTGIDIIDEQHTRSVDYLNHRHIAVATKDTSGVAAAPDQLTHYTVSHFAFEEWPDGEPRRPACRGPQQGPCNV